MKSGHLFLFTLSFPYGHGESFLESEIPYLKERFARITIVPRDRGGALRSLADGVGVDNSFSQMIPTGLGMFWAIFLSLFSNAGIYRELMIKPHLLKKWKSVKLLLYYAVIKRVIKKWYVRTETDHSIFYTYWIESFTYGLCELKKKEGFSVVTRAHRYDLFEAPHSRPYLPFRKEIYEQINQIHVVSHAGYAYLKQETGLAQHRLRLSMLGTPDPGFTATHSTDAIFRVVSCSNIVKLKRIDLIIDSLKFFTKQSSIPIEWSHIGDGVLRAEIEQLAKDKLEGLVNYQFLGSIPNLEVFAFYKNQPVDVLISLSSIEGIPVSFMEAMSCGIPVIGTDVGGVSEILNNTNGVLLEANPTVGEIARALARIIIPKNQLACRIAARQTWGGKFNARSNYAKFAKSFE